MDWIELDEMGKSLHSYKWKLLESLHPCIYLEEPSRITLTYQPLM
jgi:hypothetical protein